MSNMMAKAVLFLSVSAASSDWLLRKGSKRLKTGCSTRSRALTLQNHTFPVRKTKYSRYPHGVDREGAFGDLKLRLRLPVITSWMAKKNKFYAGGKLRAIPLTWPWTIDMSHVPFLARPRYAKRARGGDARAITIASISNPSSTAADVVGERIIMRGASGRVLGWCEAQGARKCHYDMHSMYATRTDRAAFLGGPNASLKRLRSGIQL